MFTGIVQALGRVRAVNAQAQDRDFVVECPGAIAAKLELGASIAIDGVCQTVTALESDSFTVHAIAEAVADGLQEGGMDRRVTWLEGEGS